MKTEYTLVLNADDTPINIASVRRAFRLVHKGKAVVVSCDEHNPIHAAGGDFDRPTIIRLISYVYIPYKKTAPLTRNNIFKRDGGKCVYCGSGRNLTLDHVMPRSRGGGDTWTNLVTACSKCNCSKDDRTPDEAGMHMSHRPYAPTFTGIIVSSRTHEHWTRYLTR